MDSNGHGIKAVGGVCSADNQVMTSGGKDRGQARRAHVGADPRFLDAHEVKPVMIDVAVDSARLVLGTAPARGAKTPFHILGAAPNLDQGNCGSRAVVRDPRSHGTVGATGLAASAGCPDGSVVLERADPPAILSSQAGRGPVEVEGRVCAVGAALGTAGDVGCNPNVSELGPGVVSPRVGRPLRGYGERVEPSAVAAPGGVRPVAPSVDFGGAADGPMEAEARGRFKNWGLARDGATGAGLPFRSNTTSRRWSPHSGLSALACAVGLPLIRVSSSSSPQSRQACTSPVLVIRGMWESPPTV
jgi:hypothetical protein